MIVMRVYFEKPRTTVGWKGYINDPHMDDSFRIDEGMTLARKFLIEINENTKYPHPYLKSPDGSIHNW